MMVGIYEHEQKMAEMNSRLMYAESVMQCSSLLKDPTVHLQMVALLDVRWLSVLLS
jgi:hypothetical protein